VEFTVGRHAADDGAGIDPLVAAALRQRPASVEPGAARHGDEHPEQRRQRPAELTGSEGGLGWPGEPGGGTGLGWPAEQTADQASAADQPGVEIVAEEAPVRRRGWRRIFGGGSGAERGDAPAGSTAA
jgi:hypothetical protein